MTVLNVSIKEVEELRESLLKIKKYIKKNKIYKESLVNDSKNYQVAVEVLCDYCKHLQYIDEIEPTLFFRVRPLKTEKPFKNSQDLKYKQRNSESLGRMNNPLINTLYTSFSDQTAMFECDIEDEQLVQLAVFKTTEKIRVYKLGTFGEIYFRKPLNSEEQKGLFKKYLNKEKPSQSEIRGLIALETLLMEMLYADQKEKDDYIMTAMIANAIFKTNEERIDAIAYPSKKHLFGMNLAFNEKYANKLKIEFSEVRKVKKRYETGFMICEEIEYCDDCTEENKWKFKKGNREHKYY